jgi:uncharacterized membrane protein
MMILLRLVHILLGIFWVGATIFTTFFLFPALMGDPATMGKVGQGLMRRRFMMVMPLAAILTILSGLTMLWTTSAGQMDAYMATAGGKMFARAGGVAILAFLLGITLARPAGMKAARLGAEMATVTDPARRAALQAEMAALQKRNGVITVVVTVLLVIAAAGMAIARYV